MTLFGQPWDLLLIAAVLGIVVPWRGVTRVRALLSRADLRTMDRLVMYASTIAFRWLATGLTVWRCLAARLEPDRQPQTGFFGDGGSIGPAASYQHQFDRMAAAHLAPRIHQSKEVLARFERAYEQKIRRGGRCGTST